MEQVKLPIKTKIAVWWTMAVGLILLTLLIYFIFSYIYYRTYPLDSFFFEEVIIRFSRGVIFLLPSILILLTRRKAGWWMLRVFLWTGIILWVSSMIRVPTGEIGGFLKDITIRGVSEGMVMLQLILFKGLISPVSATSWIVLMLFVIPILFLELDRKKFFKVSKEGPLPLKTEIATWLMVISLCILLIYLSLSLHDWEYSSEKGFFSINFIFFTLLLIALLSLLKKRRRAWLLSLIVIGMLFLYQFPFFLFRQEFALFFFVFPSLILLLFDRKNFLKIVV